MRAELGDSSNVSSRQEELIATLREETSVLAEVEREMKEVKARCSNLQTRNDEYNETISTLRKVCITELPSMALSEFTIQLVRPCI